MDIFNLFNRRSVTSMDENFELDGGVPNGDYNKPLSYMRPFYARFSIRFDF